MLAREYGRMNGRELAPALPTITAGTRCGKRPDVFTEFDATLLHRKAHHG